MANPNTKAFKIILENNCKLFLYVNNETNILKIAEECEQLLSWLGVNTGFTVNLWLIDMPRYIKADEWPSKQTVNGGWTTPGTNEIFIYRKEEWDRVLIHEVIHAMEWDWEMPSSPPSCWGFEDGDIVYPHLFEAWTELYAEWLYTGWHDGSWIKQREWQDEQAVQVLCRKQTNWKEDTNIFAYYVLKACLAPHVAFLWAFQNGKYPIERSKVLCEIVKPALARLRKLAESTKPVGISMRMSKGASLRVAPFGSPA
jgi:hypothetical protein